VKQMTAEGLEIAEVRPCRSKSAAMPRVRYNEASHIDGAALAAEFARYLLRASGLQS